MKKAWLGLIFLGFFAPSLSLAITAQEYKESGLALYRAGQYSKAVTFFQNAVQANPNDWETYQGLGNTYYKMNDISSALAAYQKSLQLNPNNPALQTFVNNLQGSVSSNNVATNNVGTNNVTTLQEVTTPTPTPVQYHDGLALMNHSKYWMKIRLGYDDYASGDFNKSADSFNNHSFNPGSVISGSVSYTGSASASHEGFGLDGEGGLMLNPNMGLAFDVDFVFNDPYSVKVTYDLGYPESLTVSNVTIMFTLDYDLFLPESFGRTFLSVGGGLYFSMLEVDQTTSAVNFFGTDNGNGGGGPNEWKGELYGLGPGVQLGLGQQIAIDKGTALEISALGYLGQISNFRGTLRDTEGNTGQFGLAASSSNPTLVDVEPTSNINGSERNAVIDFTGFYVGAAVDVFIY